MKRTFLLFFSLCCSVLLWAGIPPRPDPPRLVNDFAGVLTSEQVAELEHRLVAFNDSTSNVICVVIVSDLGDYSAADYAIEIGNKWGVRDKKHKNGVVILIKTASSKGGDGDIFIATGEDLEGALPDIACKKIINQQFIPELKKGNYYEAIVKGLDIILPVVAGEISVTRNEDDPLFFGFIIFLVVMIIVLIVSASRSSHNRKGGDGSSDGNGNKEDLLNAIFWGSLLSNGHRGGSGYSGSSGFGGGFGGGSFGGGGFGGFGGGGGFAGGGAGGRF